MDQKNRNRVIFPELHSSIIFKLLAGQMGAKKQTLCSLKEDQRSPAISSMQGGGGGRNQAQSMPFSLCSHGRVSQWSLQKEPEQNEIKWG